VALLPRFLEKEVTLSPFPLCPWPLVAFRSTMLADRLHFGADQRLDIGAVAAVAA
jgi:hypothetical protein